MAFSELPELLQSLEIRHHLRHIKHQSDKTEVAKTLHSLLGHASTGQFLGNLMQRLKQRAKYYHDDCFSGYPWPIRFHEDSE